MYSNKTKHGFGQSTPALNFGTFCTKIITAKALIQKQRPVCRNDLANHNPDTYNSLKFDGSHKAPRQFKHCQFLLEAILSSTKLAQIQNIQNKCTIRRPAAMAVYRKRLNCFNPDGKVWNVLIWD